jgi:hypothetical protein
MPFRLGERYQADPVRIGPLIGAIYGGIVTLCVTVICLLLHFSDVVTSPAGGESHYGLLIGFVILPLAFLAGAPWSIPFLVLSQFGHGLVAYAVVGVVLGILINGSIIGLIVGMRARARVARTIGRS